MSSTKNPQRTSVIRAALVELAERHGGELRPEAVVEAARSPTSPLHGSFTWDDTAAAEQWRLQQARQLLRAVVTYEPSGDGFVQRPVFVSLTSDRRTDGAGYRLMTTVLSDEEMLQQMLQDARDEMRGFQHKYRRLSELAEVFAAMERAEQRLESQAGAAAV